MPDGEHLLELAVKGRETRAFGVVLELIPAPLAALITDRVRIPTIGIGAGARCDGQVLVFHDVVGLFSGFKPKFVRRYAEAGELIRTALAQYAADVRSGAFPAEAEAFSMAQEVVERLDDAGKGAPAGPDRR